MIFVSVLMGLYIYNGYFAMYTKGTLADMMVGRLGPPGPATDRVLLAVSILLAIRR